MLFSLPPAQPPRRGHLLIHNNSIYKLISPRFLSRLCNMLPDAALHYYLITLISFTIFFLMTIESIASLFIFLRLAFQFDYATRSHFFHVLLGNDRFLYISLHGLASLHISPSPECRFATQIIDIAATGLLFIHFHFSKCAKISIIIYFAQLTSHFKY